MSEFVKNFSEFDFNNLLKSENKPILIDFYAKWCSPCKMQAPIVDELAEELKDKIVVGKIDVDECESLANSYGITAIPCIIIFKNGEKVEQKIGLSSKGELASMIIKYL